MRLSATLKLLAVLVAALAVGLVAAAKSMDFQRVKVVLAEQVLAATGRKLTIAGPLELRLGAIPRVIATNVTLANVAGGSRADMVKVDRVEAEVALLPLLKREVRVLRLVVIAPDILLETDAAGRGNWSFAATAKTGAPAMAAGAKDGVPAMRLSLREVRFKNGRLGWRDGRSGKVEQINLHKVSVQGDPNAAGQFTLQVVGDSGARMFDLGGRIGAPQAAGKPWALRLNGNFDGMLAKVEGSVADPVAARGLDLGLVVQGDELGKLARMAGLAHGDAVPALGPFKASGHLADGHGAFALADLEVTAGRRDALVVNARGAIRDLAALSGAELAVTVESDTLAGLSRLTGTEMPSIGPLKLTGALSGSGRAWKLADVKATLANSDAVGELAFDAAERPRLTGSLSAGTLVLADLTTPASKPGEKLAPKSLKAAGDGRLFSADPLSLAALRAFDADLSLRAARLDAVGVRLSDAEAKLRLDHGRLDIRPARALLAGGAIEVEASLDAAHEPALALRLAGRGVDLGRAAKELGLDALSGGRAELRLDFHGHGESWRALMASSSGEAVVSVGPGQLRNTVVDWGGGEPAVQLIGLLTPSSRPEETTPLACAVARLVIKDGIATADRGIAVETARVNVVGSGTIDLGREHLDLGITPRAREGVALASPLVSMMRVGGTLGSPALGLDQLGVTRTASTLAGEAQVDGAPCQTALGKPAASRPAAAKPVPRKKLPKAAPATP
jgi:uncharacterized protein involved in outer membrane biogenesis